MEFAEVRLTSINLAGCAVGDRGDVRSVCLLTEAVHYKGRAQPWGGLDMRMLSGVSGVLPADS